MRVEEFYFVEETFMGKTALLDAFAQSDLDMRGFEILNCPNLGGVINSIGIGMPEQFVVSAPLTESGEITIGWVDFPPTGPGEGGGSDIGSGTPTVGIVPIPLRVLQRAIGVGVHHTGGWCPDPGAVGNPNDYLSRAMVYKPITSGNAPPYQPTVPDPVMSMSAPPPPFNVTITDPLSGTALFYSINNPDGNFQPVTGAVVLQGGQTAYAYGAKVGYTNSGMVSVTGVVPLPTEVVLGDDGNPVLGDDGQAVTVGSRPPPPTQGSGITGGG